MVSPLSTKCKRRSVADEVSRSQGDRITTTATTTVDEWLRLSIVIRSRRRGRPPVLARRASAATGTPTGSQAVWLTC